MENISLTERICLVTAFIDIGREKWVSEFTRTNENYLNAFLPYLQFQEELIVFLDETQTFMKEKIMELIDNNEYNNHKITIIDVTDDLLKNIRAWSYIPIEKEIMESEKYRRIISHRKHHPEHSVPKYNVVQHCKVDFIKYVIDKGVSITDAKYLAWTDFGYFNQKDEYTKSNENVETIYSKLPYKSFPLGKDLNSKEFKFSTPDDNSINTIDITFFRNDKIHYCCVNDLDHRNRNIITELQTAPEHFGGFFFIGSRKAHLEYNPLYHKILNRDFYNNGLTDDDQHVMLRCYIEKEYLLFTKWITGWHNAYICFQKK